ncbi:hypothetical protein PVK06_035396 [Gossypium arboreum]|uniref:Uncharacterized protein n=1 Tax=Gossypium arboreum TaxID=29729 RepID=A0ABR0NGP5_GOSAR|nr:hypothetical protein PVK06_035396 [Gossypium arboreum]
MTSSGESSSRMNARMEDAEQKHCWDVKRRVRTKVGQKVFEGMMLAIEECMGKLEEPMEDAKESDNALEESIEDLREQSRDFVTMCLTS